MNENPFSRQEVSGPTNGSSLSHEKKSNPLFEALTKLWARLLSELRKLYVWLRSSRSPRELVMRLLKCVLVSGGMLLGIIALWFLIIFLTLPDVDEVGALFAAESTVITDRYGEELYRIHGDEDRTLVQLADIADSVKQATIAIEDQRFYTRDCFDEIGFTRAVLSQFLPGILVRSGGSTLTQQFAKNALIGSRKKRISRKIKEYMLSCKLERRYSKDEILEFYLNRIPYGHNAHGVEQASRIYFAKSASGLTIAESSILAALPQLPSYLSPYGKHARTTFSEKGKDRLSRGKILSSDDVRDDDFWIGLVGETFIVPEEYATSSGHIVYIGGRTDQVLKNMEDQGFIEGEERLLALEELQNIIFKRARENIRAPHFVLWVREHIVEQFGDQFEAGFLESGGLTITTSLDFSLQEKAEKIVAEIGQMNIDLYGAHNAALLAIDPKTGHILTYVGNRDYWDEETDGNVDIVRAPRQPGSSFKPFSYAAAFLNGASPATVLYDVPTKIGDDEPENFDGKFWGPLTIRRALGASRNIPAAKSYFLGGGEDAIVTLVADMGVTTVRDRKEELSAVRAEPYEYGWPLAIGAAEVPLYEMVQGYSTFVRGGTAIDLVAILRIEDRLGNILYQAKEKPEERDVLDPRVAYMITSILSDESVRPDEYWRSQLTIPGYPTAAKTGTSNKCLRRVKTNNKDSLGRCLDSRPDNTWTIGYTPHLVAGAWAGNASGGALFARASGLDTASHIWRQFMIAAHKELKLTKKEFEIPEGLASAQISELSGKLASSCTPEGKRKAEIFFEGETPTEFDDACLVIAVDKLTGLLASAECPADAREEGAHFLPRSILPERWPLWERAVQEWAEGVQSGTGSIFWIELGKDGRGKPIRVFRGTGAFLPLPLPLAPTEECTLALTPGRLVKPTLQILSPAHGGTATAPSFRPRISYSVGQEVQEVRYELDGRTVAVVSTSDLSLTPMIRLPRRFDTSGTHELRITLTDSYFNTVSKTVSFRFEEDRAGPQTRIISPLHGSTLTIGSEITIQVEASDAGGSIDRVQFFLGDQLLTTRRDAPYEVTFRIEGVPGPSFIRVIAQDLARNEGMDEIEIILKE